MTENRRLSKGYRGEGLSRAANTEVSGKRWEDEPKDLEIKSLKQQLRVTESRLESGRKADRQLLATLQEKVETERILGRVQERENEALEEQLRLLESELEDIKK
jgi:hypothetical protein